MASEIVHKCPYVPKPGSDEALALGCICPVVDNDYGRGRGPFWITDGCPVHDPKGEAQHGT
jgi:hypothetical protein